jgi:hypothetical protein
MQTTFFDHEGYVFMRLYTSHIANTLHNKHAPQKGAQKVVRSAAHPVLPHCSELRRPRKMAAYQISDHVYDYTLPRPAVAERLAQAIAESTLKGLLLKINTALDNKNSSLLS